VNPRLPLLLNLAVLIVTVVLVVAHTDAQDRVLRVTTRMACEPAPLPYGTGPQRMGSVGVGVGRAAFRDAPESGEGASGEGASGVGASGDGAIPGAIGQLSHIRLLKYLARVDGLEELSAAQLEAVYGALEDCCRLLVQAGRGVRAAPAGGADTRRSAAATRSRVEDTVERRLREAAIPEGELLARLVRVVVSSAG